VATKVLQLLEDDNIDVRDISKVIETDASLTLKLLRVANSPLYATRTEVNTIHQAIITLGLNRLTNIVLGVSIFSKFLMSSQKQIADLMKRFWWHASCTGMVAKSLSTKIDKFYKENEFIGGLLHDIGKLAMLQFDPVKYQKVVELVQNEHITDIEAENQVFTVSHDIVGAEIAKLWKLPSELTAIISHHTFPENAPNHKELVAAVRLADSLCEVWGAGFYEGIEQLSVADSAQWKILVENNPSMQNLDVEIFTFELEEDFKKSSMFLNILINESK
jgi:putative nucleotidyltransferase with HDIG domain